MPKSINDEQLLKTTLYARQQYKASWLPMKMYPKSRQRRQILSADDSSSPDRSSSEPLNPARNARSDTEASSDRPKRHKRATQGAWPVDFEGTKDVYKQALTVAYRARESSYAIDFDLVEDESIDWLAEKDILRNHLTRIEQQHSFIPRLGELVLWIPDLPENFHVLFDTARRQYRLYNYTLKKFGGFPTWRGGIITEVPSNSGKNGNIDFTDILDNPRKATDRNTAGFRVETMVNVNRDGQKSESKQYKHVRLKQIRPLSFYRRILAGIKQKHYHPSILYALTCMTSISTVNRYVLRGDWTGGYFASKALYLGPELITVGDTVRLIPEASQTACTDVLVVEEIRMNVDGLELQHLDSESPTICTEHYITLVGEVYTLSTSQTTKTLDDQSVKYLFRPVGTGEYGPWQHVGRMEVSYEQVVGRLYEAGAMKLWAGQLQKDPKSYNSPTARALAWKPDMSFDLLGVTGARIFATAAEERIPQTRPGEVRWLSSDSRAQSLTLRTINGIHLMDFDHTRTEKTLRMYRYHANLAQGRKITSDMLPGRKESHKPRYVDDKELAQLNKGPSSKRRGRPTGSKLIGGKLYTAAQMAENPNILNRAEPASVQNEIVEISDSDQEHDLPPSQQTPKKRSQMAEAALHEVDEDEDLHLIKPYLADKIKIEPSESSQYLPLDADARQGRRDRNKRRRPSNHDTLPDTSDAEDDDHSASDEDWWDDSQWADLSRARGGTNESENGDYDPMMD